MAEVFEKRNGPGPGKIHLGTALPALDPADQGIWLLALFDLGEGQIKDDPVLSSALSYVLSGKG